MKKAWLVARWEFLTTVKRRGYIIAVAAIPLVYGGLFSLAGLAGRSASVSAGRIPTAVVDEAHILNLTFAAEQAAARDRHGAGDTVAAVLTQPIGVEAGSSAGTAAAGALGTMLPSGGLKAYDTLDHAIAALTRQDVSAVFDVDQDYLETGRLTTYSRDIGIFSQQPIQRGQTQLADAIRASLLHASLPSTAGNVLARAYAPVAGVTRKHVTAQGGVEDLPADTLGLGPLGPSVGSFAIILLLTISIFFSASFMQQATVADRQNRMMEILLSSLDSDELLAGKLLGLGAAGLLQVGIYVALIIVPGTALFAIFQVPASTLAVSLAFYVVGYLLFASLMAGTGMLGRSAQEAAQLSAIWTLTAASPWFFVANIGTAPNGGIARALSFFPLTSPVTMMMRIGTASVPTLDIVIALVIDAVAILIVLRGASRIFRAASLMQGKRATLPEFLRWLKAA
jgi:ABC-2 type transport system permease protein